MSKLYAKMRRLQQDAVDSMKGRDHGKIILPTGTGKSWIQADVIIDTVLEAHKEGRLSVCLLGSHRLMLNEQNAINTIKHLEADLEGDRTIGYNILSIGSDGISNKDVAEEVEEKTYDLDEFCSVCRTTKPAVIKEFIKKTQDKGRHLLIISTYHSIGRIPSKKLTIDVACFDEAHTTTEEDKFTSLREVLKQVKRKFFFTATEINGKNGRGMDNAEVFGEILNWKGKGVAPRIAIDNGDILPPVLDTLQKAGRTNLISSLIAAFMGHRSRVLSAALTAMESRGEKGSPKIGPKLLISSTGVDEIIGVMTNRSFLTWAHKQGVILVSFSSSQGCYLSDLSRAHNFPDDSSDLVKELKVSRREAMAALRGLKDDQSAIIFHYDILTEGIDLPTITGVMPLRELDAVKFQQTCGRAARLYSNNEDPGNDRKMIYAKPVGDPENPRSFITTDGKVSVSGLLYKPVFWVVEDPDLEDVGSEAHKAMLDTLRDSYEVLAQTKDVVDRSTSRAPTFLEPVTPVQLPELTEAELEVASYAHVYEMIIFRGSLPEEKLKYIEEMVQQMEGMGWEEILARMRVYEEVPAVAVAPVPIVEEPAPVAQEQHTPETKEPEDAHEAVEESLPEAAGESREPEGARPAEAAAAGGDQPDPEPDQDRAPAPGVQDQREETPAGGFGYHLKAAFRSLIPRLGRSRRG